MLYTEIYQIIVLYATSVYHIIYKCIPKCIW